MTDPSADFTNSTGDEEAPIKKRVEKLFLAMNVLVQHASIQIQGRESIRSSFDFLSKRALPLPLVKLDHKAGVVEFIVDPSEDQLRKSEEIISMQNRYGSEYIHADDAFSKNILCRLIETYSQYPEMLAALEIIKENIPFEEEIKTYFRENYTADNLTMIKSRFRTACFNSQDLGMMGGMSREI